MNTKSPSAAPRPVVRLTETALMLALGTILSLIKIVDLPYGGSVTLAHMVPVLLIAYRYGARWGAFASSAYGLLQMMLGLKNFSYATSFLAAAAIFVFDYLLAYLFLCAGGWFRRLCGTQSVAIGFGALCACFGRYLCHVISGCTVWAGLSVPTPAALLFSLSYNATYMLPETMVTVLAAVVLGRMLNLRSPQFTRLAGRARSGFGLRVVAGLLAAGVAVFDVACLFAPLQNAESGELFLDGWTEVPWMTVCIVTAVGCIIAAILWHISNKSYKRGKTIQNGQEKTG